MRLGSIDDVLINLTIMLDASLLYTIHSDVRDVSLYSNVFYILAPHQTIPGNVEYRYWDKLKGREYFKYKLTYDANLVYPSRKFKTTFWNTV